MHTDCCLLDASRADVAKQSMNKTIEKEAAQEMALPETSSKKLKEKESNTESVEVQALDSFKAGSSTIVYSEPKNHRDFSRFSI